MSSSLSRFSHGEDSRLQIMLRTIRPFLKTLSPSPTLFTCGLKPYLQPIVLGIKMLLSVASAVHLFTTSLILDLHRKAIDIFLMVR